WINAEKFCRLLGGRLGEFTTEAQLDHVVSSFPLLSSWPAFAGGIKRDGKWVWNHSKKIIDHGKWRPSKPGQGGPHISILGKSFIAVKNMKLPILLCEWDEKEYDKRNEKLRSGQKMPLELTRFRYGTREFMLVRSGIHWNGAFRTCELLGGRLAVLDTPELQKFAIQKLEVFENLKILLGGYAKRNKWYWVNGKEIKFTPKEDRVVFLPSRNRNFLTVKNGVFYNSQWAEAFLCEWDRSSCSSH
ncbi:MAG: C-type lectin domain-containing protein, partial [Lentisphaeria bacterium]|nr:C-type lectin domain-containing protein [Lentisphaeria bacterium]